MAAVAQKTSSVAISLATILSQSWLNGRQRHFMTGMDQGEPDARLGTPTVERNSKNRVHYLSVWCRSSSAFTRAKRAMISFFSEERTSTLSFASTSYFADVMYRSRR